uniref:Plant basic secretory protein n=1 Tax=Mycena chlorophos TaxID=658473 RepID=A0ABQ0M5W2_MYCCL|nr:predicted protein [Mycena chlorophos]
MPPTPPPEPPTPPPEPTWPFPKFTLRVEDLAHPGAQHFFAAIRNPGTSAEHDSDNALEALRYAVLQSFIWLYAVPECAPTNVQQILLVMRPMDGVAYTFGSHTEKEIHFSLDHVWNQKELSRARQEILGVLVHEVVHCYQHNGNGTAPGGFIEGVADYVRLHANLGPPHWRRAAPSRTDKWDAGYERTAYFLDWIDSASPFGEGTVRKMNAALVGDGVTWDNARVFETFTGEKVGALWRRYRVEFGGEVVEESEEAESEPRAATPVVVDETAPLL